MKRSLNVEDVLMQLTTGVIVPLTEKQWKLMEGRFAAVETIETGVSGQIQLLRRPTSGGKKTG